MPIGGKLGSLYLVNIQNMVIIIVIFIGITIKKNTHRSEIISIFLRKIVTSCLVVVVSFWTH